MSPTERDLRDALRRGEGDGLDPDAVVAAARGHASRRRARLAAIAASVVVVGGIATAVGVLAGGGSSGPSGAGGDQPVFNGPARTLPAGVIPSHTPTPSAADCPRTFDTSPPGGGTGPLLPSDADTVVVCAYGSTGSGTSVTPAAAVLTGTRAVDLVRSLDEADVVRPRTACPLYRVADDHRFTFVALRGGKPVGSASTTLGNPPCSVVVRSAVGTRYGWTPPSSVQPTLAGLHP